jgi:hypothetical protein
LQKNYKNHLRRNNYEVCTAVALCFPNILDGLVLEIIKLFEDKIGRPPYWSNDLDLVFCHQSFIYAFGNVYFNRTLISYVHRNWKYSFSERKLHALPFILCYELNSVCVNLPVLVSKGDG